MSCPCPKRRTTLPPTDKQLQVLRCIEQHRRDKGFPPTARELCAALGLSPNSTQGVFEHLNALAARGLLTREEGKARTARATPEGLRWLGSVPSTPAQEGVPS